MAGKPVSEDTILEMLKTVYDPEIPVNIVDLGLIYRITLPTPSTVNIDLTLTAPGCGMGEVLVQEIELKLKKHPHIDQAIITLVFDPPWDRSRLSVAAQLELGLL
ncbi:MAG: iron-sulfur cluster assembly protein [Gammaproteobacteria bacterium]